MMGGMEGGKGGTGEGKGMESHRIFNRQWCNGDRVHGNSTRYHTTQHYPLPSSVAPLGRFFTYSELGGTGTRARPPSPCACASGAGAIPPGLVLLEVVAVVERARERKSKSKEKGKWKGKRKNKGKVQECG